MALGLTRPAGWLPALYPFVAVPAQLVEQAFGDDAAA